MYPIKLSEKEMIILNFSAEEFIKNHYKNRKYNRKKIFEILNQNNIKINRNEQEYFLNRIFIKLKSKSKSKIPEHEQLRLNII